MVNWVVDWRYWRILRGAVVPQRRKVRRDIRRVSRGSMWELLFYNYVYLLSDGWERDEASEQVDPIYFGHWEIVVDVPKSTVEKDIPPELPCNVSVPLETV